VHEGFVGVAVGEGGGDKVGAASTTGGPAVAERAIAAEEGLALLKGRGGLGEEGEGEEKEE
jgi:hypothetical protein